MLDFDKEQLCYHCGACAQACARKAIEMKPGEDGFIYPEINTGLCVSCGACENVCPRLYVLESETELAERSAYAATAVYGINADRKSASGGVFYALAKMVLDEGGYVAGCIFDEKFHAQTVVTRDTSVVEKMRGSKYVWSDTTRVFEEVKGILKAGETVLFSGMPCQTAALLNFCGKQKKLITCTLFCHGNGSEKMMAKYIEELRERKQKGIKNIIFRYHQGKRENQVKVEFDDGSSMIEAKLENMYLRAFLEGVCGSGSCLNGNCQYKGDLIPGDIVIGDFWGYKGLLSKVQVSAVLSNRKGDEILQRLIRDMRIKAEEVVAESIIEKNQYLLIGRKECKYMDSFTNNLEKIGFFGAYEATGSLTWIKKLLYKTGTAEMMIKFRDWIKDCNEKMCIKRDE